MKKDDAKSASDKLPGGPSGLSGEDAASPASPDAKKVRSAEPAGSGVSYGASSSVQSQGAPSGTLDQSDLRPGVADSPPGRAASTKGSSQPSSGDAASVSSAASASAGADPLASAGSTKAMGAGAQGAVWAAGTSPSAATMGSGQEKGIGHDLQRAGDTPGTNPERTGYVTHQSYGGVTGGSTQGAGQSWTGGPAVGGERDAGRQDLSRQSSGGSMSVSGEESTFSGKEIGGGRDTRAMGSRGAEHASFGDRDLSESGGRPAEGSARSEGSARFEDTGETSPLWRRFEAHRDDPARWRGNQNVDSSGAMTNSDMTGAQWGRSDEQAYPWREGVGRGHINEEWSGSGSRSSAAAMYAGQGRSEGGWASSGSSFGASSHGGGSSFTEEARRMTEQGMARARSSLGGPPREWAMSFIEGQKRTAADSLRDMADAFRGATDQLRQDNHPEAAHYAESAARQVERAADYLFGQDIEDMVHGAQTFARRHPEMFVGGAIALGFLAARFFRSHGRGGYAAHEERYGRESSSWRDQWGGQGREQRFERGGQRQAGGEYHAGGQYQAGGRHEGGGRRDVGGQPEGGGWRQERGGPQRGREGRMEGYSADAERYREEYGDRLSAQPGPGLRETDTDPSGGASHREMRVMQHGESSEQDERGGRGRSY